MKLNNFIQTWSMSTVLTLWLTVSNSLLALTLFFIINNMLSQHDRVVLTPPYLNEQVSVGWNSASENYYKAFGMYFSTLIGNITPSNVDFVVDILSTFLEPEIYTQTRPKLIALSKDAAFKQSGGASFFSPEDVSYEPETSKVFVSGKITTTSYANSHPEQRPVVYEMEMHIRDGRPRIGYLNSYDGSTPRTLKWLAANPEQEKKIKEQE